MFGFIANALSATVKIAVTPLTVVRDVVVGEPFETTETVLGSALEDIEDMFDIEEW